MPLLEFRLYEILVGILGVRVARTVSGFRNQSALNPDNLQKLGSDLSDAYWEVTFVHV